ncbi:retrovirus-related Pol polyprotein from transposon opus [Trichonephila clavipes]|nr:retrovirus-related Pol polyprotein from transposon opus [Trichonephila clavipes]
MKFVRDSVFDRLISLEKGKVSSKISQLRKRHKVVQSLTSIQNNEWSVSSTRIILFNNPCIMTEVNAVQIPAYNKSGPRLGLWFIMCESTFALATPKPITESITKYNYIVSHIPPDIASLVRDILGKPDATDPYGNLKTELYKPLG